MSKFHRDILILTIATFVPMAMLQKEHVLIGSINSLLQILSVSINVCKKWFNALFVTQLFHFASYHQNKPALPLTSFTFGSTATMLSGVPNAINLREN